MPYGLKNALPTFVRAMHKTFGDLIRDLIEVYIDDITIKIKSRASLLDNLAQVFDRLRSTRTKLNLNKYVFGVTVGKLLGFLSRKRGKSRKDQDNRSNAASCPHQGCAESHGLLGRTSQFISRLVERVLLFFKVLCRSGPFIWIDEVEEAF
jgi:hypothetical protein